MSASKPISASKAMKKDRKNVKIGTQPDFRKALKQRAFIRTFLPFLFMQLCYSLSAPSSSCPNVITKVVRLFAVHALIRMYLHFVSAKCRAAAATSER